LSSAGCSILSLPSGCAHSPTSAFASVLKAGAVRADMAYPGTQAEYVDPAELVAEDVDSPLSRMRAGRQNAQQCALASAVWSEQCPVLPGPDLKVTWSSSSRLPRTRSTASARSTMSESARRWGRPREPRVRI